MGKLEPLNVLYGKVRGYGLWNLSPRSYGGLNLDLFYTVIFLEELKKLNRRFFCCDVGSYLAMTHLNAEGDERIKQDYLALRILVI
jgi:alkylation response protein AidB-like acyl-CoA dehydrogenase